MNPADVRLGLWQSLLALFKIEEGWAHENCFATCTTRQATALAGRHRGTPFDSWAKSWSIQPVRYNCWPLWQLRRACRLEKLLQFAGCEAANRSAPPGASVASDLAPAWAIPLLADVAAIGSRLGEIEKRLMPAFSRPLSTADATEYVGFRSQKTFRRWAAKWRVRPCGRGWWPVDRLNAGIARWQKLGQRSGRGSGLTCISAPN